MLSEAGSRWAAVPIKRRLARLRALRRGLAVRQKDLLGALRLARPRSSRAELLSSELIPLLDSIRFLEREAERWLAPRRPGGAALPLWLRGVELQIHREPLGVILVIGPSNYPLFLAGNHCLQALAAGNTAWWKPAPGCGAVARLVHEAWVATGGEPTVLRILEEDPAVVGRVLATGEVAKVVVTGSQETGRAVLRAAAEALVPVVAELSGSDVMWVSATANLERAVQCLLFGLRLNGGRTCVAPRRVLVERAVWPAFRELVLLRAQAQGSPWEGPVPEGATLLCADPGLVQLEGLAGPALPEIFGSFAALVPFDDRQQALAWVALRPGGLGVSLFGKEAEMLALAPLLPAGVVTVNDLIAPTADPRLPFGGRGTSGFGTTRGAEGLLEMTAVRAVQVRSGGLLRHLEAPRAGDDDILAGYLQLAHAGGWRRLAGLGRLLRGIIRHGKDRK